MYQILLVETGEVVGESYNSPRDAQAEACRIVHKSLEKTPQGRRVLGWCKQTVTWQIARSYAVIQEMVGVWIDTQAGRILPEDDDDERICFRTARDRELTRFGLYRDGEFVDLITDQLFEPERVTAFLIIPDNDAR